MAGSLSTARPMRLQAATPLPTANRCTLLEHVPSRYGHNTPTACPDHAFQKYFNGFFQIWTILEWQLYRSLPFCS
jgi:hypothetical protein